ncbi:MAG: hypothetical protein RLZZ568_1756 [Cyanobacteriota bacterium]|jgi:CRISPR-associated protein (TIGR03985 family)
MTLIFEYPPTVSLLCHLAQGQSLRSPQNLCKAVRMWILLRSIYGNESDPVYCSLGSGFSYLDWRNAFFTDVKLFHQKFDKNSIEHTDPKCFCHKSLTDWLFKGYLAVDKEEWYQDFNVACYLDGEDAIASFLDSLEWKSNTSINPDKNRIFACVAKTLKNNFEALAELGYLVFDGKFFHKTNAIEEIHKFIGKTKDNEIFMPILQEDLSEIPKLFQGKVGGLQRFFMHIDYAVGRKDLDNDWPYKFKEIWENKSFPVIKLTYNSVSLHREVIRIIYPVCIYYYQRAIYLCAYGQSPHKRHVIDWYNYRVDRIIDVKLLDWSDSSIPGDLTHLYSQEKLFTPDYIDQKLREAFGFNFYKPKKTVLLCFDKEYSEKYIDESFRHETFEKVNSCQQLLTWKKRQNLSLQESQLVQTVINKWQSITPSEETHSYFLMDYRTEDINVVMRLRAWGPRVQVLFPWELRQRIAEDSRKTTRLYQDQQF